MRTPIYMYEDYENCGDDLSHCYHRALKHAIELEQHGDAKCLHVYRTAIDYAFRWGEPFHTGEGIRYLTQAISKFMGTESEACKRVFDSLIREITGANLHPFIIREMRTLEDAMHDGENHD